MDAKESEDGYSVKLEGKGIAVDRQVDQAVALQILNLILGGHAGALAGDSSLAPSPKSYAIGALGTDRPAMSLREFLEDVAATKYPEKITAIGEYIIEVEGAQDFSRDDAKSRFRPAGETPPANFHRDFGVAIQNGWIAEDPKSAGRFYVTKRGKDAIVQRFSGKASAKSVIRKRSQSQRLPENSVLEADDTK